MNALETEATEVGNSSGWAHANYVGAYGGDMNATAEVPGYYAVVKTYFTAAFAEGVERFQNNQYPDGTPMTDD